ncbi:hypothetical protein OY671_004338 [Metschnikowia pulcherrima]|nr:hypothetical protein OY671_004338 [Metschnikowia pulcherrima]
MLSSESLVSKYFSEDQKLQLAKSIAENLTQSPQDSSVLAELISHLDSDTLADIYPRSLSFILQAVSSGKSELHGHAITLLKSSSVLLTQTWDAVLAKLRVEMSNSYNFHPEVHKYINKKDFETPANDITENSEISAIFEFLSRVYTTIGFAQPQDFNSGDKLICIFLGHRDDHIATSASQLIRWRIDSIVEECLASDASAKYYWDLVFDLLKLTNSKSHITSAFVLWLRLLSSEKSDLKASSYFQNNVVNRDFYWQTLQSNLVGHSHETRKLCLSILQLSVKQIRVSFETPIMSWSTENKNNLLREWSRYTTLFEVLGIDTSLHQTQAAVHDIVGIISEESLIHPSWGFCLLSTGFKASMDSVRKYSTEILFSIKPENLHLLKHGLSFLEHHYLPYLMLSRHFVVRPKSSTTNEICCDYAEKFSSFICAVMKSLSLPEELSNVSYTILSVLAKERDGFDAVRIYTCQGLVEGLQGKRVLQFGKHDELLVKLFDNLAEGDLFRKAIQTLNLHLLLNFEAGTLAQIGGLLSKFVSFNGYTLFTENIPLVSSYVSASGFGFSDLVRHVSSDLSVEESIVTLRLAHMSADYDESIWSETVLGCSDYVIAQLIESGNFVIPAQMQSRCSQIWTAAVAGDVDEDVYNALGSYPVDSLVSAPAKPWSIWEQIQTGLTSKEYGTLCYALASLRFFNRANELFGLDDQKVSLSSLARVHKNLLVNSGACAKQVSNFYKFKESVSAEFHTLLAIYVDQVGLRKDEFTQVLSMLTFETSHYTTLLAIAKIFKISFERGYADDDEHKVAALIGLGEAVAEMDADRFKLSEKPLHVSLIEVFLHETVLKSAVSNEILNDCVLAFAEVIVFNAYGRRGLMTALTKALLDFQSKYQEEFEKLAFVPTLLVKAMVHRELQSSAYRIEKIVGDLYDQKIAISGTSQIYSEVYGADEVAYKVWLLVILNSVKSAGFAKAILDVVFDETDPYHFFNVLKPSDGAEEHTRIQMAKIMISVLDKVDIESSVKHYFHHLIRFVENDPSPMVRVYFEWALAHQLMQKPELSESIFDRLTASLATHEMQPILVTLYERVLFLMVQAMDSATEEKYLTKLITIIVPAASTNKAVTRHFSMSLAISIHDEIRKKNLHIDENLSSVIDNMYRSALATDAFGQFRSGDACLWNIVEDLDLVNISGGLLLRLYDRDVDFVEKSDFEKYLSKAQTDSLNHPIGNNRSDLWVRKIKEIAKTKSGLQESGDGIAASLQTKSGAWSTVMDVDAKTQLSDVKRSDLIVVASLVDKPPNLGGICRLCDVLGAGLLTLHDLAIKEHPQFKSVAVTADHWMPMAEVKPDGIVRFLREKKAQGYTLIGLEQTDKSVVLDSELKFPAKSLILLGREKEGIPGELLAELDLCVEIKQVGVVRSMNIQTATAVIVHAYSSQNC